MKRSFSLRMQLFALMALLVLLQSIALVSSLMVSRVFLLLDAEAFRLFVNTTGMRAQAYNTSVSTLVGNMAAQTEALSLQIQQEAARKGIAESEIYLDDAAYLELAATGAETLVSLLRSNTVSGAFLMLNGSNSHKDAMDAHSAVYLRNSATGSANQNASNYQLEIGPIAISQQNQIPTSVNWKLDLLADPQDDAYAYYFRPMQAAAQYPKVEMERYGYWSTPVDILGNGQQVVSYTMPLVSRDGSAFGVLGVEISLSLYTQHYLSGTDLPYQNSFFSIASIQEDAISLGWFIPGGPIAQVYLQQGETLPIEEVPGMGIYETHIAGLGDMYCAIEPVVMYSRNSPFHAESWSLIGYVPQEVLHETSSGIRALVTGSIVITTALAFVAIFVLVYITTRKISGLSQYIRGLTPYADIRFTRTGIREIDELTAAVERLNQDVIKASETTSKILELTLMPIGGYEITEDTGYAVLTEYIYRLLGIPVGKRVSIAEWERAYTELVRNPAQGYENTYLYVTQTDEKWLRILEAPTDTGRVGIVLDVSKDIEEQRRLAHELDYDALTHLYSRVAFKREVFRRIKEMPDTVGAMVFIDLDNLKYTNDTYGHDMGDRLIIRAGEIFRQFETYGGLVSRISGDEFAIYLHGYETKEEVHKIFVNVFERNAEFSLQTSDGVHQRIRFSSGIAYYPFDSDNVTDLLKLSDYAMYEAKHRQKGSLFEFNKDSYKENAYLLENREAINLLLDEELIHFAYQPIVDLRTGEIFAYEALMRPLLDNFKSPLEILTVAAAQSKLGQLEHLVLTMAFRAIREQLPELGDRRVFINSIPSQALTDEDQLMLERNYKDLFSRVVIEMTEEESQSPEEFRRKLAFVRKYGMKIAIDDFGSGYSNEVRILSTTPDIVKVDIELIRYIDQDRDKQLLLSNLISFCHPKGVLMVAEGVERREELEKLIELGVDYVQGYYTGRPAFEFQQLDPQIHAEIIRMQNETSAHKGATEGPNDVKLWDSD